MRMLRGVVAVAGLLVAVSSLLPWFRSRYGWNGPGLATTTASAWQASSVWAAAVLLCVAAAVAGVLGRTRLTAAVAAGAATTAAVLTAWQWQRIPAPDVYGGSGAWIAADPGAEPAEVGDIVRDRLQIIHIQDLHYDVAWGLYTGLAAMTLLAVLLWVTAAVAGRQAVST